MSFYSSNSTLMRSSKHLILTILCGLVFSFLYYQSYPGINILIFDVLLILTSIVLFPKNIFNPLRLITAGSMLMLGVAFTITAQGWTLFVHFIVFVAFSGALAAGKVQSMVTIVKLGIFNLPLSCIKFITDLKNPEVLPSPKLQRLIRHAYYVVPAVVIIAFIYLYQASNPIFEGYVASVTSSISSIFNSFFEMLNWQWIGTFVLGLAISIYAFVHFAPQQWLDQDANTSQILKRVKHKLESGNGVRGFKNEWRAGIFLLATLNVLIAFVNAIDIYYVWFNFSWTGEYLRQFVHEGTYLLLLSILISIAIVLYFFRGNLNFYRQNKWMRWLCYGWIAQNGIMTISVLIRNLHYIDNFALAGKRIGVLFFLALVLFGLATVAYKVWKKQTFWYLLRWNSLAAFVVLVWSAIPNWNHIIIDYNFAYAEDSFLHLDYLASFDNESIPYLDVSLEELKRLEVIQKQKFPFEESYMTPEVYIQEIEYKKTALNQTLAETNWKEWTLAQQKAADYLDGEV